MTEVLKEGWKYWRFDEMATMVNDRIDKPSSADVEYYVGLEHLDPDSLKIRRWGSPSDVGATKLLFKKGDIIFGRRRVYQRKVAVADFDGICSAHAMVLRACPDVVQPEYLPYFMQSDLFMERAKEISVGSLSPTINWKTLAKEQFLLPPLEEQKEYVKVLSAMENCINTKEILIRETERLKKRLMKNLFTKGIGHTEFEHNEGIGMIPKTWVTTNFANTNLFHIIMGQSPPSSSYNDSGYGLPFIQGVTEFGNKHPIISKYCSKPLKVAKEGDILISVRAPVGEVNIALCDVCIGRGISAIHCIDQNLTDYTINYIESHIDYLHRIAAGSIFEAITKQDLQTFIIAIPPQEEIKQVNKLLSKIATILTNAYEDIAATKLIKMKLINQIFTNGDTIIKQSGGNR
ncbi:restriction endonuclease subunit S [Methanocalculus sp. MC3]